MFYFLRKEIPFLCFGFVSLISCVRFLQRELERLKDGEKEIQALQQEVDEDTTEVIPSAM